MIGGDAGAPLRPKIISLRPALHALPDGEQWAQARAKAEAAGVKFCALVCEDADGALFIVPVNVESDVHLEAMCNKVISVFDEDEEDVNL